MILRGILVASAGFVFIFSPGVPMRLLARPGHPLRRELLYWGIGLWLVTLPPGLFFQSLLRQIAQGGGSASPPAGPGDYLLALPGSLLGAFFLQGAIYLFLRRERKRGPSAPPPAGKQARRGGGSLPGDRAGEGKAGAAGLTVGFGVGLIAQVFTGLSLVGAGFRLAFGDAAGETLSGLASAPLLSLLLGLLALVLFRPARLVVSGALGVLVARALGGRGRYFWLAVLLEAAFAWAIVVLQTALGSPRPGLVLAGQMEPGVAIVTTGYYALAFALGYGWLRGRAVENE